ncbi:hypothetical protein [Deinococcus hopiensis]|uniref:Uncharacterized protein n=1 Tax=Deinococcus hopiensis KR-140 TaxID=695939 RepID=A0A1W1UA43_9DEIO|nr:hypothetical protein [Deinococcus hopiensis]SMB77913.1 hypothetical protein SAMN00790413_03998 [Deinococcus hopiensis KR-140]
MLLDSFTVPRFGILPACLSLSVTRAGYGDYGYPVPEFLRAYDGSRLLGISVREAAQLVTMHPGEVVLAASISTYRLRDRVRFPRAYVRRLIQEAA